MRVRILKFNAPRATELNFARAEFSIAKFRENKFYNSKIPLEQIPAIVKFREAKIYRLSAVLRIAWRNLAAKFSRAATT